MTATMTATGVVDVSVPLPRTESTPPGPVVGGGLRGACAPTRTVVSVWRPDGLDPARLAEFTAGRLAGSPSAWTRRLTRSWPPWACLAVEASAADLAGVANAAGCAAATRPGTRR